MVGAPTAPDKEANLWPREDVYCRTHRHTGQCFHAGQQQGRLQQLMNMINQEQIDQSQQQRSSARQLEDTVGQEK